MGATRARPRPEVRVAAARAGLRDALSCLLNVAPARGGGAPVRWPLALQTTPYWMSVHEAGHAVMAEMFGSKVLSCEIGKPNQFGVGGLVRYESDICVTRVEGVAKRDGPDAVIGRCNREVLVTLAGGEAERARGGRGPVPRRIAKLLLDQPDALRRVGSDGADVFNAWNLLDAAEFVGAIPCSASWFIALSKLAGRLARHAGVRDATDRLAAALLAAGRLEGDVLQAQLDGVRELGRRVTDEIGGAA